MTILAEMAEQEGGVSSLVGNLLREHFGRITAGENGGESGGRRQLTAFGMLAGEPGSADEFMARKAEEKKRER